MKQGAVWGFMVWSVSFCLVVIVIGGVVIYHKKTQNRQPYGLERRIPWTMSHVMGTPEPPLPFCVKPTFSELEFTQPVYIAHEPSTNWLLVVQQDGKIFRFKNQPAIDKTELLLDVGGFLMGRQAYGLTFHPNYTHNGYLYIFSNGPRFVRNKKNRVSRFIVDRRPPYRCDPKSERVIIEWESNGHNGGDLAFGPDGFLYITAGDGTSDSDTLLTGQDLSTLNATVMRINVDSSSQGKFYSIPRDNPFSHLKDARPEIWAYGLRNPWRMTFDSKTGRLWVGNVGQDRWETIYLVRRGENYGWSRYESSHPFYPTRTPGPTPIVKPTVEHPHSEARCITGGVVYYGGKFPELHGVYLYGDYSTGRIWGLRHDGEEVTWHEELADTTLQIVSFAVDPNGEILIVNHMGGIFRLERSIQVPSLVEFPTRLSHTGLFTSVEDYQIAPGLIPYSVNAPLWSDGAYKERAIALPGNSQIEFTTERGWNFPEGTVLVKTFSLNLEASNPASRHRIETRLLVRQSGEWTGYTYAWNEAQTDAILVAKNGIDRIFTIRDTRTSGNLQKQRWHYPSRAECMVCHTRAANFVLGLTTLQMNKAHDYSSVSDNQLRTLSHLGVFTQPLSKHPEAYPKLVSPYDHNGSLEARARSYLHVNCANCHVKEGGGNSLMELEFTTKRDKANIFGIRPQHGVFGIKDARLIAPGSPERSIIYYRVSHRGEGQMPPLGTLRVDNQAVQLLSDWIVQMDTMP